MIEEITSENFEQILHATPGRLIVEFYSPSCAHCRQTEAGLAELAQEDPDTHFAKLNVLEHPELAELHDVTSLPTLLLLKDGELKNRLVGFSHKLIIADQLSRL